MSGNTKLYSEFHQHFNPRSTGTATEKTCPDPLVFPAASSHLHTMLCLALAQAVHFNPDLLPYQAYVCPNICASPWEEEGEGWDKIFSAY